MSYFPRRTTQERQAEAAVYRARTEAAMIPTVDLKYCEYDKTRKVLKLASEYFGMPREFFVRSHHTGKEVRFVVVGIEDKLFDVDQWDGEQQIYRPVGNVPNVDHMVIYHAY
jgi:cupin superfamily acireductone dioxygenase involved in methionine salvage